MAKKKTIPVEEALSLDSEAVSSEQQYRDELSGDKQHYRKENSALQKKLTNAHRKIAELERNYAVLDCKVREVGLSSLFCLAGTVFLTVLGAMNSAGNPLFIIGCTFVAVHIIWSVIRLFQKA